MLCSFDLIRFDRVGATTFESKCRCNAAAEVVVDCWRGSVFATTCIVEERKTEEVFFAGVVYCCSVQDFFTVLQYLV